MHRFDRGYLGVPESSHTVADDISEFQLPEEIVETSGLIEGAVRTITVNAYERNKEARRRCIAHYGPSCVACGFEFGTAYGSLAKDSSMSTT
jgi:predicted HNH restriction endonuclease